MTTKTVADSDQTPIRAGSYPWERVPAKDVHLMEVREGFEPWWLHTTAETYESVSRDLMSSIVGEPSQHDASLAFAARFLSEAASACREAASHAQQGAEWAARGATP